MQTQMVSMVKENSLVDAERQGLVSARGHIGRPRDRDECISGKMGGIVVF